MPAVHTNRWKQTKTKNNSHRPLPFFMLSLENSAYLCFASPSLWWKRDSEGIGVDGLGHQKQKLGYVISA